MNKTGPIIIVEDDRDDQFILEDIFEELGYNNELIFFDDGEEALQFLQDTDIEPFLLLSDINMPKLNGLELREKIYYHEDIRLKTIPLLFLTTSANHNYLMDAYSRSIQGFFIKPSNYEEIKNLIIKIIEYWKVCESPNNIEYDH